MRGSFRAFSYICDRIINQLVWTESSVSIIVALLPMEAKHRMTQI